MMFCLLQCLLKCPCSWSRIIHVISTEQKWLRQRYTLHQFRRPHFTYVGHWHNWYRGVIQSWELTLSGKCHLKAAVTPPPPTPLGATIYQLCSTSVFKCRAASWTSCSLLLPEERVQKGSSKQTRGISFQFNYSSYRLRCRTMDLYLRPECRIELALITRKAPHRLRRGIFRSTGRNICLF